jgi:hypothetical protein
MNNFDITHEGRTTLAADRSAAIDLGYPTDAIAVAMKSAAKAETTKVADAYRAKLASTSAGKLQAYRIKEQIARDPANADAAELALIEREAAARGISRDGLISLIAAQATAYRQNALLIEALEAEAGAAIAAIPNDASDIEAQIANVLEAAKGQAEIVFGEAVSLIGGG